MLRRIWPLNVYQCYLSGMQFFMVALVLRKAFVYFNAYGMRLTTFRWW